MVQAGGANCPNGVGGGRWLAKLYGRGVLIRRVAQETFRRGMVWRVTLWHGTVWYGMVQPAHFLVAS